MSAPSFGNPVRGPRIVPFGQPRTALDYLPNGHPAFRVTQRFTDWDTYFHNRLHGALDMGNYNCGDEVLAMDPGAVIPLGDPNGAIGVEVHHANGYRSQYWHLNARAVSSGSVTRGQVIGFVGKTGIDIAGCHLHLVVLNPSGVTVDPWPLLAQNKPPTYPAVKFNAGVNGVNLRDKPDARSGRSVVLAIAYSDADPTPNGIIWQIGSSTTKPAKGAKVGNTGSQRRLYDTVKGTDGQFYNVLKLAGTGRTEYVNAKFMHRV